MFPKKKHPKEKNGLHTRNKHRERYDFAALIGTCPELAAYVRPNKYNDASIDFADAAAVMMLNKALLKHYYRIDYWNIPAGFLCPPIPGRADYIHHIADLLATDYDGIIPKGMAVRCLDIGVGANCIYPIIGHQEYGWSFVATDVAPLAIQSAKGIIEENIALKGNIELRLQQNENNIFRDIIASNERFDVTICNPPFHASLQEAQAGSLRKWNNLNHKKTAQVNLNFGGQNKELYCNGGEEKFVQNMIVQSKEFAHTCCWFSTLVAKEVHLKAIYTALKMAKVLEHKTIAMAQGNKISRIVAWTFLSKEERKK